MRSLEICYRCNSDSLSVEDALEGPEFRLPEDIEAALKAARKLPAYVPPEYSRPKTCLGLPDPVFGDISDRPETFAALYKSGKASVADVVRFTLAAMRLRDADPRSIENLSDYWTDVFYGDREAAKWYSVAKTDKEDTARIEDARRWLEENREIFVNFLSGQLYEGVSDFVSRDYETPVIFDEICDCSIEHALDVKFLSYDEKLKTRIEDVLSEKLHSDRSNLLERSIQNGVNRVESLKNGILESSTKNYKYDVFGMLHHYLGIPEIRNRVGDDNAAVIVKNMESLQKFVGIILDGPGGDFASIIDKKTEEANDLIRIDNYATRQEYHYKTVIPNEEDDRYSKKKQLLLENSHFKRLFIEEVRHTLNNPYVLADSIMSAYEDGVIHSVLNIMTSSDNELIEELGIAKEAARVKEFLKREGDSQRTRYLALLNLLPENPFTDDQQKFITIKSSAEKIYKGILSSDSSETPHIPEKVHKLLELLNEAGIDHEMDEETLTIAAINTIQIAEERRMGRW